MSRVPVARWLSCAVVIAVSGLATFFIAKSTVQTGPKSHARMPPAGAVPAVALAAALPVPVRSVQATLFQVESDVKAARSAGASDDEVYRLRVAALPAATVAMLAERERAESAWALRMQAWRAQRARLAPSDAAGLKHLLDTSFNDVEQQWLATQELGEPPRLLLVQ